MSFSEIFCINVSIYIPGKKKKKRIRKIFLLSSPFNAKILIVIKYLILIKSDLNLSKCGVDLCFPCVGTKHIMANGKRVSEAFIHRYCLHGISNMLYNCKVRKRYVFVM